LELSFRKLLATRCGRKKVLVGPVDLLIAAAEQHPGADVE